MLAQGQHSTCAIRRSLRCLGAPLQNNWPEAAACYAHRQSRGAVNNTRSCVPERFTLDSSPNPVASWPQAGLLLLNITGACSSCIKSAPPAIRSAYRYPPIGSAVRSPPAANFPRISCGTGAACSPGTCTVHTRVSKHSTANSPCFSSRCSPLKLKFRNSGTRVFVARSSSARNAWGPIMDLVIRRLRDERAGIGVPLLDQSLFAKIKRQLAGLPAPGLRVRNTRPGNDASGKQPLFGLGRKLPASSMRTG